MRILLVIAFVLALLVAVAFGLAWIGNSLTARRARPALEDPKEILRRRYAAGEIDEDEYLRRMSGLSQDW